jgi:hypothetical protein
MCLTHVGYHRRSSELKDKVLNLPHFCLGLLPLSVLALPLFWCSPNLALPVYLSLSLSLSVLCHLHAYDSNNHSHWSSSKLCSKTSIDRQLYLDILYFKIPLYQTKLNSVYKQLFCFTILSTMTKQKSLPPEKRKKKKNNNKNDSPPDSPYAHRALLCL